MELCKEMGSEHEVLLYHTEVRWLSRGRVLNRVFELRAEIAQFLMQKNMVLYEKMDEPDFVFMLAYLADVFTMLNELNISLQGRRMTVFDANEKIASFKQKLNLWKRRASQGNFANFSTLDNITEDEENIPEQVKADICDHLSTLANSFENYFKYDDAIEGSQWIRNPFTFDMDDDNQLKDELIELKSKAMLQKAFETKSADAFWSSHEVRIGFPALASEAIVKFIPFVTTYLCESGFSTMLIIKTKFRNRLDVRNDMRLALSNKLRV
jgi:hypothetical protein